MTDIFKSADWAREALEREAEAPVLTGESSLTEFSAAEYDEFFGWLASKPIVPPYKFEMSAARLLTPDLATRMYGPVFTWLCFGDVVGDGFEYWPDRKKKL